MYAKTPILEDNALTDWATCTRKDRNWYREKIEIFVIAEGNTYGTYNGGVQYYLSQLSFSEEIVVRSLWQNTWLQSNFIVSPR